MSVMRDSKIGKTFCYIGKKEWYNGDLVGLINGLSILKIARQIGCNITMIMLYAKHFHYGSKTNILSKGLMLL
jgi:hypothetical protein